MVVNDAEPLDGLTPIQLEIIHAIRKLKRDKGYLRWEPGRPRTIDVRLPGEPLFPADGEARRPAASGPGVSGPGVSGPGAGGAPADVRAGQVTWVPMAGRIAAGQPILAQESIGDYLPLPAKVVGRDEGLFILEIAGDSMTGAGIFPGDLVVVRPLFRPPKNGDIVAATIDGVELEGTVKTYKKTGRNVWLIPQNPAYDPIPGDRAKFAGKVVAVLRRV